MAAVQTVLGAAITTNVQTPITVSDYLGFPSSSAFTVLVGSEYLRVTAGYGTTSWTVTRGYLGSTAATALNGATVTYVGDQYTDLGRLKTRMGITNTTDDAVLASFAVSASAVIASYLDDIFLGPSTDTIRTYDGSDAVGFGGYTTTGTRLWIPGGIRTCTQLETALYGGSLTTVTSTAYHLGPSHNGKPGVPYSYIEFLPWLSSWPYFPAGFANVRITGTFGYAAVPDDVAEIADALAVQMWQGRQSSTSGYTGGGDFNGTAYPFLTAPMKAKLDDYLADSFVGVR